jgi:hypothetical protein
LSVPGSRLEGTSSAVDTFIAYVGVYPNVADADADYELVKDLHTEAGLIDGDRAAIRRALGFEVAVGRAKLRASPTVIEPAPAPCRRPRPATLTRRRPLKDNANGFSDRDL